MVDFQRLLLLAPLLIAGFGALGCSSAPTLVPGDASADADGAREAGDASDLADSPTADSDADGSQAADIQAEGGPEASNGSDAADATGTVDAAKEVAGEGGSPSCVPGDIKPQSCQPLAATDGCPVGYGCAGKVGTTETYCECLATPERTRFCDSGAWECAIFDLCGSSGSRTCCPVRKVADGADTGTYQMIGCLDPPVHR
jgi:hypothetical protein